MRRLALTLCAVFAVCACTAGGGKGNGEGITPEKHTFFPITPGTNHALGTKVTGCESCHPPASESFKDFTCVGCHIHDQGISDQLHRGVIDYAFGERTCFTCHPTGEQMAFSHTGIAAGTCASCHAESNPFAALPKAGFTHPDMGGSDCGGCHGTARWTPASSAPNDARDPARDLVLDGLVPSWSFTTIARVTPLTQALPMRMHHDSSQFDPAAKSACSNCHPDAASGSWYPGSFHAVLAAMSLPDPTGCSDCHAPSEPLGFVGPFATMPARVPASGEMRHEGVAWASGAPSATKLVTQDCTACHRAPGQVVATWATAKSGAGVASYHGSLTAPQQPQSCLDCHANSRPVANLTLDGGITLDHQLPGLLGDCRACHGGAAAVSGVSWAGGAFHAGQPLPATCLPCHAGERPTSNRTTNPPFDFGTNARGLRHGANQDCVICHTRTQDWTGGNFVHGPATISGTQCISCHTTQRPAAVVMGFDHARDGTGDCFGCHQATVVAGSYRYFNNPATGMLPGGDWKNGVAYPGSFISSNDSFITVAETTLNRSGPNNLVTSTTQVQTALYNGMLHTSQALPAALNAGGTGSPDYAKCWHCHTHDAGTVTGYSDGVYHPALINYRANVGGPVTPLPQPTSRCNDCHASMWPRNIVQRGTTNLQPMDHAATFTATVNIGGQMVSGVSQLDCSVCHASPGGNWNDGRFHSRIGAAVPRDCNGGCHFPLMADAAKSDLTSGTTYKMTHRSQQLTSQACERCHATALGQAATTPVAAALWRTGVYHAGVAAQPSGCIDCHTVSDPVAATQSTVQYALTQGATGTNRAQWMSHTSPAVLGRDCAVCHSADARPMGSAWSRATVLHRPGATVTTCRECHGLNNGRGAVPGTNNNLPAGLIDTKSVSPVSQVPNSGVPAGTSDQLTHADVNVSPRDCNFCHTQAGVSTAPAIAGREWAQASFHVKFSSANPLQMNGTTGRCSNCHLNVRPGAAYTSYNHSALTGAPGSTDCASCHSWPGTGAATAPNWKGAVGGAPVFISVGGFTVAQPPAPNATTVQGGIANLPHPPGTCSACHLNGVGAKNAFAYDHALAPTANCAACHEAGSNLVATPWNGTVTATNLPASCGEGGGTVRDRQGDTRALGITNIACGDKANTMTCGTGTCSVRHFYPADCKECHGKPAAGIRTTSTGTAYVQAWRFPHTKANMQLTTCCMCHARKASGECKP